MRVYISYPEEIFLNLADVEKHECAICCCVLQDSRKCVRGHRFCYKCICKWVYEYSRLGSCPLCRADTDYNVDNETIEYLSKKAVQCIQTPCNWKGTLDEYDHHAHKRYADAENMQRLKSSSDYNALYPNKADVALVANVTHTAPPKSTRTASRPATGRPTAQRRSTTQLPQSSTRNSSNARTPATARATMPSRPSLSQQPS
jgi:hypothetical protein